MAKIKTYGYFNSESICQRQVRVAQITKLEFDSVETIMGKGENVGHQHFLLFPQSFYTLFFSGSLKVRTVW